MIPLPRAIAEPLGELRGGGDAFTGVTTDSRAAGPGDLFVAVRGGVAYVDDAQAAGAATLVPHDALEALAALGRAVRDRSDARVVAITGSVGKTSTKDILAALCAPVARTVAAEHGFNNEIGVPLTLCRVEPDTQVVILEMGMRGLGQIAALCDVARPDVAVVTAIAPVHLELLGTMANIVQAKSELVHALPAGGTAVLPAELASPRDDIAVVRIGTDVRLGKCDGADCEIEWSDGTRVALTLPTTAPHHAENAVAALAAYRTLGLPLSEVPAAASGIRFSRWRGEELPLAGGGLLVNDAWNANPPAMRAALAHFAVCAGNRRRVAVLGYMAELGPDAPRYHEEVGRLAADAGVDVLIAVGEHARAYLGGGVPETHWAQDADAAARVLEEVMRPGDCVLVKASRAVGLERVAEAAGLVTA